MKVIYNYIKNNIYYKSNIISYIFFLIFFLRNLPIKFFNIFFTKYIDVGSGNFKPSLFWFNFDKQIDGTIISKDFNLYKNNINLVYCSHFLEHIDDEIAKRVFLSSFNTLKKGGVFRVVVPDPAYFINLYKTGDKKKLQENIGALNLSTWKVYNTNTDSLEQLLLACIMSISNLDHKLTIFKHQENLKSSPPTLLVPGAPGGLQEKLKNYYCGPPININDALIKERAMQLNTHDFLKFVFSLAETTETKKITNGVFNSWHKNYWPLDKIKSFADQAGFSRVVKSEYLDKNFQFLSKNNREKVSHKHYSLYVNLIR